MEFVVEMVNIRKEFPGVVANDDITLHYEREKSMLARREWGREIHAHENSVRHVSG